MSGSTKKTSSPPLPIDECLFGPTKHCPSNVWEAVLSRHPNLDGNDQTLTPSHKDITDDYIPTKTLSNYITHSVHEIVSLSKKNKNNTHQVDAAVALIGIDDLDEGRWGSGMQHEAAAAKGPHVISMQELRRIASQGIVDEGCHRPVAWRVLLGYLPLELSEWKAALFRQRILYRNLVGDLFVEQPRHEGNDLRGNHGKRISAQRKLAMTTKRDEEIPDNLYKSPLTSPVIKKESPTNHLELLLTPMSEKNLVPVERLKSREDGNEKKGMDFENAIGSTDGIEPVSTNALLEINDNFPGPLDAPNDFVDVLNDATDKQKIILHSEEPGINGKAVSSSELDGPEMDMPADNSDHNVDVCPKPMYRRNRHRSRSCDDSTKLFAPSTQRRLSLAHDCMPAPLGVRPAAENMLEEAWDKRKEEEEMIIQSISIEDALAIPKKPAKNKMNFNDSISFDDIGAPLTRTAADWMANHSEHFEEENEDLEFATEKIPTSSIYSPGKQLSRSEMIPPRIRDEWKRSGRDLSVLDQMGIMDAAMNTLLVLDDGDDKCKRRISVSDDPLSTDADSQWFQYFDNASLLDEIRKDVVRTHPDLCFFLEPESNLGQRRYAALERILFVWAKLNKGVRYVQGMNEIVGTIYYVLANDMNEMWACEAEADTYFLFNTLMTEMRDVFVPDLDDADTGIQGRINNMTTLLSLHDPEVRCHLDDMGIDASFYAIRWLTTLLSREFLLPDTIRLWDSMFASTHKDNFMRYVCVTMVMIVRAQLLKGDFSTCLRLLQGYPSTNIDGLLESSRALWIYESQVTLACHKGGMSLHQALTTITPPPSLQMAYGLVGGIASRLPDLNDESPAPLSGRGGSFLSGAKNLFSGLGRETRLRRTNS